MSLPARVRRYFNPFRLAAYLLVIFCAGHTWGALVSTPQFGRASDAVLYAMKSVHFNVGTFDRTWFGFYLGFGLIASIFFLLSAVVTWFLGGLLRCEQRALAPITWALFFSHAASAVISWTYFFVAPGVLSTLVAALLGAECLRSLRPDAARKQVAA